MGKFFGNLHAVLGVGLVLALLVMVGLDAESFNSATACIKSTFIWLHVFFGILWIGLLYYLNFVQVPTMPKIPAEQKGAITGFIAPRVFFFFRYAALLTVVTGLIVAWNAGWLVQALTMSAPGKIRLIGVGMWLALIMAFNVWFIIWPAQKKILGLVEATAEEKAVAAPRALAASRTNLLLSLAMIYCMVAANALIG
ncbi:MAG: urate hydroxylase PuuD [Novosphingobium sp.]